MFYVRVTRNPTDEAFRSLSPHMFRVPGGAGMLGPLLSLSIRRSPLALGSGHSMSLALMTRKDYNDDQRRYRCSQTCTVLYLSEHTSAMVDVNGDGVERKYQCRGP